MFIQVRAPGSRRVSNKATFPIGPIIVLFFVVYDLESYKEIPKGTTKESVGSFRVFESSRGHGACSCGASRDGRRLRVALSSWSSSAAADHSGRELSGCCLLLLLVLRGRTSACYGN